MATSRPTAAEKSLLKRCKSCVRAARCRPPRFAPNLRTLEKWESEGGCKTPSGEWVEPDGHDQYGCPSWMLVLGFI